MQSRSDRATRAAGATVITYNLLQLGGVVLGGTLGGATGATWATWATVVTQSLALLTLCLLAMRYTRPTSSLATAPSLASDQAT